MACISQELGYFGALGRARLAWLPNGLVDDSALCESLCVCSLDNRMAELKVERNASKRARKREGLREKRLRATKIN